MYRGIILSIHSLLYNTLVISACTWIERICVVLLMNRVLCTTCQTIVADIIESNQETE